MNLSKKHLPQLKREHHFLGKLIGAIGKGVTKASDFAAANPKLIGAATGAVKGFADASNKPSAKQAVAVAPRMMAQRQKKGGRTKSCK